MAQVLVGDHFALCRDVDCGLDDFSRDKSEQTDDDAGNHTDDGAYAGHHQTRMGGKRHGSHHRRLFRVTSDVLREKYDVRARHPDTVYDSDEQAVKKMPVWTFSRDEVSANEKNQQPEDGLDIGRDHKYGTDRHR